MILKKGEGEEHIDLRSFDTNGDGVGVTAIPIEPKIEPSQIMMDLGAFDYKETAAFTEGKEYKVEYENNTKCGKATVTVTPLIEHFSGTGSDSFLILPQKANVKSLVPGKKSLKVTLKSQKASGVSGYQIAYKVKGTSKWKTKITPKNKVTLKKFKSKKTVQVKARAFVKVNGEKHYGAWSKAIKSKKIK